MPTIINQIVDSEAGNIILRVAGSMELADAVLLEKIIINTQQETSKEIVIDFADLNFLDSDSAPILRKIERLKGLTIVGVEIFLQAIVNETEKPR